MQIQISFTCNSHKQDYLYWVNALYKKKHKCFLHSLTLTIVHIVYIVCISCKFSVNFNISVIHYIISLNETELWNHARLFISLYATARTQMFASLSLLYLARVVVCVNVFICLHSGPKGAYAFRLGRACMPVFCKHVRAPKHTSFWRYCARTTCMHVRKRYVHSIWSGEGGCILQLVASGPCDLRLLCAHIFEPTRPHVRCEMCIIE